MEESEITEQGDSGEKVKAGSISEPLAGRGRRGRAKNAGRGRGKRNGKVSGDDENQANGGTQVSSLKHVGKFRYLSSLAKDEEKLVTTQARGGRGRGRGRGRGVALNHSSPATAPAVPTDSDTSSKSISSRGRRIKPNNRWAPDSDFEPAPAAPAIIKVTSGRGRRKKVQVVEEDSAQSVIDSVVVGDDLTVVSDAQTNQVETEVENNTPTQKLNGFNLEAIPPAAADVAGQSSTIKDDSRTKFISTQAWIVENNVVPSRILPQQEEDQQQQDQELEESSAPSCPQEEEGEEEAVVEDQKPDDDDLITEDCRPSATDDCSGGSCEPEQVVMIISDVEICPPELMLDAITEETITTTSIIEEEEEEEVGMEQVDHGSDESESATKDPPIPAAASVAVVDDKEKWICNSLRSIESVVEQQHHPSCSNSPSASTTPVYEEGSTTSTLISPKPVKVKSRWRRTSELEQVNRNCDQSSCHNSPMHVVSPKTATTTTSNAALLATVRPESVRSDDDQLKMQQVDDDVMLDERFNEFETLDENLYLTDRKTSKEVKRMLCDCTLSREEIVRGELGCGEDCINRLLMIEWY